jgi:hypothetical protein
MAGFRKKGETFLTPIEEEVREVSLEKAFS